VFLRIAGLVTAIISNTYLYLCPFYAKFSLGWLLYVRAIKFSGGCNEYKNTVSRNSNPICWLGSCKIPVNVNQNSPGNGGQNSPLPLTSFFSIY
jgi:hypothetical protein